MRRLLRVKNPRNDGGKVCHLKTLNPLNSFYIRLDESPAEDYHQINIQVGLEYNLIKEVPSARRGRV